MKINNITAYQNSRQNFKGAYVLKGRAEDVEKAVSIIMGKRGHSINFNDFDYVNLQSVYFGDQPDVKQLVTTNEHCKNAISWRDKYKSKPKRQKKQSSNRAVSESTFIMCIRKMMPYFKAQAEMDRDNKEPMDKLLEDLREKAERTLGQIKKCAVVPMEKIEVLDAKEVLKAIESGRFNFVDGVIKK